MPDRVHIEPVDLGHAAGVQEFASDPAIGATSNVPSPYPPDGALSFIRSAQHQRSIGVSYSFAVIDGAGNVVGMCGLSCVDRIHMRAELGYWIGRPYWNQGYATEAARQVTDFAFGMLGLRALYAECLILNTASRRVLTKLGFVAGDQTRPHPKGLLLQYELAREQWQAGAP